MEMRQLIAAIGHSPAAASGRLAALEFHGTAAASLRQHGNIEKSRAASCPIWPECAA
jgi:hypothetical protein